MSIAIPLLSGAAALLGSKLGADAQLKAAKTTAAASDRDRAAREARIDAGSIDPFGNVINRKDPATGALKTSLAPDSQRLADALLAKETGVAQTRGDFAGTSNDLLKGFAGFTPSGGRPDFSLTDARGIVEADNNRTKNAIINPAINNASLIETRRAGGTSNFGSPEGALGDTLRQLIERNMIGGEREALDLKSKRDDDFIKNSLGLSQSALSTAAGGQGVNLPGVASLGEISNATNAIPKPAATPADLGSSVLAGGASDILAAIAAQQDKEAASTQNSRLIDALIARLGNQNNAPIQQPGGPIIDPATQSLINSLGPGILT